jgi:Ca2+:H+ antiporter
MRNSSQTPGFFRTLFQSPLDWLLLAVPVAFALRWVPGWRNETLLFGISALGIIPLAGWMGRATEALAARTGAGIGALLNATFGNAAELIIALMALSKGLTSVVKASLTGSIIGNMLLVLGASAVAGGVRYSSQKFNKTAARVSSTSLGLAGIALIIPTVFHFSADLHPGGWSPDTEQRLSLAIAIVLLVTYLLSLLFSLVTHKRLFTGKEEEDADAPAVAGDAHQPIGSAIAMLAVATILVAFLSEFLVGSIEATRKSLGFTETFVGVVVVAIVGNAAEHSTAIWAAMKNKMDLSISIATGSSLQVALFVTPILIFASYAFGRPMNLEFSLPEIVSIALAVWIVAEISGDGETNWFEGVQLLSVYVILAILFFYLPDAPHRPSAQPHAPAGQAAK